MNPNRNTILPPAIPSPCVSLCKINLETDLCEGCWRTLDEIVMWVTASEEIKQEIWQKIALRKAHPDMPA